MDTRAPRSQVRHLRNLLSLVFTVAPEVAEDADFLERAVILTGVTWHTSPDDLLRLLVLVDTQAAVLVRDYESGNRCGLVILANSCDRDRAIAARVPRQILGNGKKGPVCYYRRCIKATAVAAEGRWRLLVDAAADEARRRSTTALLRPLVPPVYVEEDVSVHLRCVFLREDAVVQGGGRVSLSSVCRFSEMLEDRGSVCAAVSCEARKIAVLVYDDAFCAEKVARSLVREPIDGVRMYDSSMFPLAAATGGAAAGGGGMNMIPAFFTQAAYKGRVLVLRGLRTEHCDAREIASYIRHGWPGVVLEASIVARTHGVVIAVFGSARDALRLLLSPDSSDIWNGFLDQTELVSSEIVVDEAALLMDAPPPAAAAAQHEEAAAAPLFPGVDRLAFWLARDLIEEETDGRRADDVEGIAVGLIKLLVFSRPALLQARDFADRAVILFGLHPAMSDALLRAALSPYGGVDGLVASAGPQRAALVVFSSWIAAARLLLEPAWRRRRMGFLTCQPVPRGTRAALIAYEVYDALFDLDENVRLCSDMCD